MLQLPQETDRRSALVRAAGIATKFIAFPLLLLYTHYLSPSDFAVLVLLYVTMRLLDTIVTQGMTSAVLKAYAVDFKDDAANRRDAVSTAFLYTTGSATLVFGVLALFARPVSVAVTTDAQWAPLLRWMFFAGVLRAAQSVPRQLLQASPRERDAIASLDFAAAAVLNVYFVVIERMGLAGIVYSEVVREGAFMVLHTVRLWRTLRPRFSTSHLKRMLRYGLPLVPRGAPYAVIGACDRYLLVHLAGATQLGLYAFAYRLAEIVDHGAVRPLLGTWPALHAQAADSEPDDGQRLLGRYATYFVAIVGLLALTICVLAEPLLRLVAGPGYLDATRFVPILVAALVLAGGQRMLLLGVRAQQKQVVPRMMGAAALFNVVCNAWLIPRHGTVGAAVSTLMTFALLAGVAWRTDRSRFGIGVEWARVLRVSVALGLTFAVGSWVTPDNLVGQIAAGCALILLYPALLGVLGFYNLAELEMMRGLLNRRLEPNTGRSSERRKTAPQKREAPASAAPEETLFDASTGGKPKARSKKSPRPERAKKGDAGRSRKGAPTSSATGTSPRRAREPTRRR